MLATKMFEIRDFMTLIPVMATKLRPENEAERWLLARSGYGPDAGSQAGYVILTRVDGDVQSRYDQFGWPYPTLNEAHRYIREHFEELESGAVVDVEFITGKRTAPKLSEAVA